MKTDDCIFGFDGDNTFLCNFFVTPIVFEGADYPSSEHAFQAAKVLTNEERVPFQTAAGLRCGKAKHLGQQVKLRKDWEQVKNLIMFKILTIKFTTNEDLKQKLLATGDKKLVEANTWGDVYWGVDKATGKGKNVLGELLMELRLVLQHMGR
jgi:ribA/ribD-fused uncharacterized protein